MIETTQVKEIILQIAAVIEENKDLLTDLDNTIGDSDHGINMSRGFKSVSEKLSTTEFTSIETVIKTTAMTLVSTVGGASGALYGTFFLKMAGAVKDKEVIDLPTYSALLNEGITSVKQRGKSDFGEKTMLDVLIPYAEVIAKNVDGDPGDVLTKASERAKLALEATKNIKATKGRASYLGDRSIGHIDPGSMSSFLMISVVKEYVLNQNLNQE